MSARNAEERARIDAEIRARFERHRAVLIGDMSGFSRITRQAGIVHFLGLIHRMHELCLPLVRHTGTLVKTEADNLYASFATAQLAVETAIAMRRACDEASADREPHETIELAVGIAYGPILDLDGKEFYGDAVNIASKLGEDLASGGDVFVARPAFESVTLPAGFRADPRRERISSVDIDFVALRDD
jgi:class 3 adenylate cyclase